MEYLTLNNVTHIPLLGLGTFQAEPNEVYTAVYEALKIGYRHIDCSPVYGNEKEVGQALSDAISEGILKREEVWVTSKLWNDSHEPQHVEPALRKTLEDLQLDYVDLYLIHWPVAIKKGVGFPKKAEDYIPLSKIPLGTTWKAMESLQEKGLSRSIGVSNFNTSHLDEILDMAKIKPVMNQVESHPFLQQLDLKAYCDANGIALTAFGPLGSTRGTEEQPVPLKNETVMAMAEKLKATPAQVLIKWSIQRGVVVIPKSANKKRLAENFGALQLKLSDADMNKLATLDRGHRFFDGSLWEVPNGPYTAAGIWGK